MMAPTVVNVLFVTLILFCLRAEAGGCSSALGPCGGSSLQSCCNGLRCSGSWCLPNKRGLLSDILTPQQQQPQQQQQRDGSDARPNIGSLALYDCSAPDSSAAL